MKNKTRPGQKQDVITLADLAPRHRVTGGSDRRVFGTDSHVPALEENPMATKKSTRDLPSKSPVKGGSSKLAVNDNLTLVRS